MDPDELLYQFALEDVCVNAPFVPLFVGDIKAVKSPHFEAATFFIFVSPKIVNVMGPLLLSCDPLRVDQQTITSGSNCSVTPCSASSGELGGYLARGKHMALCKLLTKSDVDKAARRRF